LRTIRANRKSLLVERKVTKVSEEWLRIDHRFTAPGFHASRLVTGDTWIYATVRLEQGRVAFLGDSGSVSLQGGLFGMLLPPRSIIRLEFHACVVESTGYLSRAPLRQADAVVFPIEKEVLPRSVCELEALLDKARSKTRIGSEGAGNAIARRAKAALDGVDKPISDLSVELGVPRETLTRAFTKAYGLSPLQYRMHGRVMSSVLRLGEGEAILNVALGVGFGDLSRFYKQFVRIAAATPKLYQFLSSQSAKTEPPQGH
jgi:AraC-like DNA-binding protein